MDIIKILTKIKIIMENTNQNELEICDPGVQRQS